MFAQANAQACGENWSPFNRLLGRYLYVGPHPLEQGPNAAAPDCAPDPPSLGPFDRPPGQGEG